MGGWSFDFLVQKNYEMSERVGVEIELQTQTLTIFPSNETAIIGKIAQLKVCICNMILSTVPTLSKTYSKKKFFLPWYCPKMSIILISIGPLNVDDSEAFESIYAAP